MPIPSLILSTSFPTKLIEGEHFVLADLLKLNPSSSSQAISGQEDQVGAAIRTLVRSALAIQPQSRWPTPWPEKNKKEDMTMTRQTKVAGAGLEDFVDWTSIIASEPTEKEEMSMLAVGFAALMRKRATNSDGETTPSFDGKRMKQSSPDEKAQKDWAIISMDSPDRASNDQSVLEGTPNKASAPLDEGIPVGVAAAPVLPLRPVDTEPRRKRLLDQVLLSTYVPLHERIHPPTGMIAPNLEGAREIIHR